VISKKSPFRLNLCLGFFIRLNQKGVRSLLLHESIPELAAYIVGRVSDAVKEQRNIMDE